MTISAHAEAQARGAGRALSQTFLSGSDQSDIGPGRHMVPTLFYNARGKKVGGFFCALG